MNYKGSYLRESDGKTIIDFSLEDEKSIPPDLEEAVRNILSNPKIILDNLSVNFLLETSEHYTPSSKNWRYSIHIHPANCKRPYPSKEDLKKILSGTNVHEGRNDEKVCVYMINDVDLVHLFYEKANT